MFIFEKNCKIWAKKYPKRQKVNAQPALLRVSK